MADAQTEKEPLPRIVQAPTEAALYDLLISLNDEGHHPEVACLNGGPFIAGLWDIDYAARVHYVVTEADSGQVHCCGCSECRGGCADADWRPTFPFSVVMTEDPDPSDLLDGPAPAWWRKPISSPAGGDA